MFWSNNWLECVMIFWKYFCFQGEHNSLKVINLEFIRFTIQKVRNHLTHSNWNLKQRLKLCHYFVLGSFMFYVIALTVREWATGLNTCIVMKEQWWSVARVLTYVTLWHLCPDGPSLHNVIVFSGNPNLWLCHWSTYSCFWLCLLVLCSMSLYQEALLDAVSLIQG